MKTLINKTKDTWLENHTELLLAIVDFQNDKNKDTNTYCFTSDMSDEKFEEKFNSLFKGDDV